jgi:hypothetical protein
MGTYEVTMPSGVVQYQSAQSNINFNSPLTTTNRY